ncbi:MAG: 50S ribosomal protein L28 [Candidatus Omnitrophota bacterium]
MANICEICGKGPVAGRSYAHRGLAKTKGGVGIKITGITKRRFLPNLQNVRILVNGTKKKAGVCTACIRSGKITKA